MARCPSDGEGHPWRPRSDRPCGPASPSAASPQGGSARNGAGPGPLPRVGVPATGGGNVDRLECRGGGWEGRPCPFWFATPASAAGACASRLPDACVCSLQTGLYRLAKVVRKRTTLRLDHLCRRTVRCLGFWSASGESPHRREVGTFFHVGSAPFPRTRVRALPVRRLRSCSGGGRIAGRERVGYGGACGRRGARPLRSGAQPHQPREQPLSLPVRPRPLSGRGPLTRSPAPAACHRSRGRPAGGDRFCR